MQHLRWALGSIPRLVHGVRAAFLTGSLVIVFGSHLIQECTMALAFRLQAAGYTPTELHTEAAVNLEKNDECFSINRSTLTLRASVPNLDQDTFDRLARDAEQNCPVSKVLKTEITLDAQLVF